MAVLQLERKAGLTEFSDEVVRRAGVPDLKGRVFYADPDATRVGLNKMTSILRLQLKDGKVVSGRAGAAKGHPTNPMRDQEAAETFRVAID
jgi:2-methylcitrate dehydratase PrpD